MAEGSAVLAAFIELFDQLGTLSLKEIGKQLHVRRELNKLRDTLKSIKAVLASTVDRQDENVAVQHWLREVKDVASDAKDLLEEFDAKNRMRFNLIRRRQVSQRIENINRRLGKIKATWGTFGFTQGSIHSQTEVDDETQTSSFVNESLVVGRKIDKEKIVEALMQFRPNEKHIPVIPIVGMGGIGKTTLAQIIYNDRRVKEHFELKMWVHVSRGSTVDKITRELLEVATKQKSKIQNLELMQQQLEDSLRGRRYLLVLDNMRNISQLDWEKFCCALDIGAMEGSKIIATTRNVDVARIIGTEQSHDLMRLSDNDSWTLFSHSAFKDSNPDGHPELVSIGKEIVKMVEGLPLALVDLGGRLRSEKNRNKWEYVLKDRMREFSSGGENIILRTLKSSYGDFSPCLKQCFKYCALFPKMFHFEKAMLVQLWMAQDFIEHRQNMITEDTGGEYVDELCRRSFLQCSGFSGRNGQSVYTMHNVIHDMAVLVAGEECHSVTRRRSRRVPQKTLHASLLCDDFFSDPLTDDTEMAVLEPFFNAKGLRSLVLVGDSIHWFKQVPRRLSKDLCHLYTLDLSNTHLHELPNSIDELVCLRYLALNNTKIKFLPRSICKLHYLQTLGLRNCYALQELPKKMRKLKNLRHLDLSIDMQVGDLGEGACLISIPSGLGKLTSIQTLSRFVVGKKKGCGIGELKDLIHLIGDLCISNLHNVCSQEEVIKANLQEKQCLDSLELQWGNQNLPVNEDADKEVLKHLQPHSNVKQLKIKGYRATKFPDWITSPSSSNIVIMKLSNCKKCQSLPSLGQLPLLKELLIEGMDGVVCVDKEFCGYGANKGFPSLEKLQFKNMLRLRSWTGVGEGELSSLRQLIIKDCFYLIELPSQLPAVEELEIELYPRLVDFERFSCSPKELNVCCITLLTMLPRYTSLTSLIITGIPTNDLPLELQDHATIERMEIRDCARLIFLPAKGLPTHLTHLAIKRCPRLKHLTEDLKYLSALRELTFEECEQLEPPPNDGLLNSLEVISINKCPSLKERFRVDVNIEDDILTLIDDEPAITEEFSLSSTSGSVFFQEEEDGSQEEDWSE